MRPTSMTHTAECWQWEKFSEICATRCLPSCALQERSCFKALKITIYLIVGDLVLFAISESSMRALVRRTLHPLLTNVRRSIAGASHCSKSKCQGGTHPPFTAADTGQENHCVPRNYGSGGVSRAVRVSLDLMNSQPFPIMVSAKRLQGAWRWSRMLKVRVRYKAPGASRQQL